MYFICRAPDDPDKLGTVSIWTCYLTSLGIHIIKIRHLIFIIGNTYTLKDGPGHSVIYVKSAMGLFLVFTYAIIFLNFSDKARERVMREVKALAKLDNGGDTTRPGLRALHQGGRRNVTVTPWILSLSPILPWLVQLDSVPNTPRPNIPLFTRQWNLPQYWTSTNAIPLS